MFGVNLQSQKVQTTEMKSQVEERSENTLNLPKLQRLCVLWAGTVLIAPGFFIQRFNDNPG